MNRILLLLIVSIVTVSFTGMANDFEKDVFNTSKGELAITFIGHGTLMMEFDGKVIHIDPVRQYADYSQMPKADLILITHVHVDHLDLAAIEAVKKENTEVIITKVCAQQYPKGKIMRNGDYINAHGLNIQAVPAYNIVNKRDNGTPFHPKGEGNGYVIDFGGKKVYVAGDTENIPEMKSLQGIDIAFLPMNLPYTMTPEMVIDAAKTFMPKILYPYHFGNTNTHKLVELMKDEVAVEVRIRKLN